VKLVIAGKSDSMEGEKWLRAEVEKHDVQDKVIFDCNWITEEQKIDYFANCLAAIYIPFDEDSYGYPSLEAHHAGKCVISTTDAGGTSELIVNGVNGFLAEPTPQSIAECMDRLYRDRKLAESMGQAGAPRLVQLGVTWDRVIEKLLL
jgi:glycosyltransferase involved in cell wall biosynthesis